MKLPRLLKTTALRLAMRYAFVYVSVLAAVLAALAWVTGRGIDADVAAALEHEMAALTALRGDDGGASLIRAIDERQAEGARQGRAYLLVGPDGRKLAGNLVDWPEDEAIPLDGKVHAVWIEEEVIPRVLYDDDAHWPVVARRLPDGSRLLLARAVRQPQTLREITEYLLETIGTALLLALVMSVTLGHRILGRMDTIGLTASEIMAGDLSQRVPLSGKNDEFDALATRLNAMLERIEQLVGGIRDVTDNVAHDLRGPLTRLRNRLEVTLLEERNESEYREVIAQSVEDAQSLIDTFNALLGIAQAEAGSHRAPWGVVDLDRLVSDLADLYAPLAEEGNNCLELLSEGPINIPGSRDLLAQAVGNLLENAIKYTPDNGVIRLQLRRVSGTAEVSVADTGPGIPDAEKQRVLERFVRLENSRHTPGNGLGLSLVRAVARLHKASLLLEDADPGLRVTIRFGASRDRPGRRNAHSIPDPGPQEP